MQSPNNKLLTAIFDLGWYAPTFSIFEFLTSARVWAQARGFGKIKLVVLKRRLADAVVRQPQAPTEYDFRIHDIVLAACGLFPLAGVEITGDAESLRELADRDRESVFPSSWNHALDRVDLQVQRYYLGKFLGDHVAAGGALPPMRIPAFAFTKVRALLERHPQPWITITIRRARHLPTKNSNLDSWKAVADHFRGTGASVFLLPDIETLEEFEPPDLLSSMAVANLSYRSALYDASDLNLAVSSGTAAPLTFNPSAVWILAKVTTEGTNTSLRVTEELTGMRPGDEFWSGLPWQRALWTDDTEPESIIQAGEKLLAFMDVVRAELAREPLVADPWGKPDGSLSAVWKGLSSRAPLSVVSDTLRQRTSPSAFRETLRSCGPQCSKNWMVAAEEELAGGQFDAALAMAKEAIRLDARYPRPYQIAAKCLARKGQPVAAERYALAARALKT